MSRELGFEDLGLEEVLFEEYKCLACESWLCESGGGHIVTFLFGLVSLMFVLCLLELVRDGFGFRI